jgi:hypothetical protein
MVFQQPGFLLIRRSLVRAQVEEPTLKALIFFSAFSILPVDIVISRAF